MVRVWATLGREEGEERRRRSTNSLPPVVSPRKNKVNTVTRVPVFESSSLDPDTLEEKSRRGRRADGPSPSLSLRGPTPLTGSPIKPAQPGKGIARQLLFDGSQDRPTLLPPLTLVPATSSPTRSPALSLRKAPTAIKQSTTTPLLPSPAFQSSPVPHSTSRSTTRRRRRSISPPSFPILSDPVLSPPPPIQHHQSPQQQPIKKQRITAHPTLSGRPNRQRLLAALQNSLGGMLDRSGKVVPFNEEERGTFKTVSPSISPLRGGEEER